MDQKPYIIVYCPHCNTRFGMRPHLRGLRGPCPVCRVEFTVQGGKDPPPYDKPDDFRWPDLHEPGEGQPAE
jgi:hypothetical protein